MKSHTPTPWHIVGDRIVFSGHTTIAKMEVLHSELSVETIAANAAFIVRAVNAHEVLVEALFKAGECLDPGEYPQTCADICAALKLAKGDAP